MVESNVWKLSNILTPSITEKFEIPRYQRGYAWESKQVEEFCEDLWETNEDTKKVHHFGTIYCEEDRENNTVIIVDGQQRITTSMIFLCVARDWADELISETKEADNMNDSLFRFDNSLPFLKNIWVIPYLSLKSTKATFTLYLLKKLPVNTII